MQPSSLFILLVQLVSRLTQVVRRCNDVSKRQRLELFQQLLALGIQQSASEQVDPSDLGSGQRVERTGCVRAEVWRFSSKQAETRTQNCCTSCEATTSSVLRVNISNQRSKGWCTQKVLYSLLGGRNRIGGFDAQYPRRYESA
jgi:hypothetical protein